MSKKVKMRLWVCICVIAGVIDLAIMSVYRYYVRQENIFFLEYENEYEKDDTIIYKYNSINDSVIEIGKMKGKLQDCVINKDETYITGVIYDEVYDEGVEIVRYDLVNGTVETLDVVSKISALTGNKAGWYCSLIYDGGNKFFISFEDENGDEKWLLYDLTTDQYDIVEGENGTIWYLEIRDDNLWYIAYDWTLCQYDLETKERTKIMKSARYNSVIMPETGLVAYKKSLSNEVMPEMGLMGYIKALPHEGIYLYNTKTQKSSCIAWGGWNIYYGDFLWTDSRWSDNGREFFYIKSFPGFFNASTERLMIYDVLTHRSRCIYKVKMTLHDFQYVMKR